MPLPEALPLAGGRVAYDARDIIAALKEADIIHVGWPGPDGRRRPMDVIGCSLVAVPELLDFSVRNERQAFALREAKIAVDAGDDVAAYFALQALAEPGTLPTH